MVERDHPSLSLSRQSRLLSIGRSSLYYEPKGESAETLALMRRIDELFLKYPFYGARRIALHLRREGGRIPAEAYRDGPPVDMISRCAPCPHLYRRSSNRKVDSRGFWRPELQPEYTLARPSGCPKKV